MTCESHVTEQQRILIRWAARLEGVRQMQEQRASIVSTRVCAAPIPPVGDLTGCRMPNPTVGGGPWVW